MPREQQVALAKQYGVDINSVIPAGDNQSNYDKEREVSEPARLPVNVTADPSDGLYNLAPQVDAAEDETSTQYQFFSNKNNTQQQPLKLFGYDVFAGQSNGFEAMTNMPVPGEYILGAGDEINVQLFGKESQSQTVVIDRNGVFFLEELGPLNVAGLTFSEFKTLFNNELKTKVIGINGIVNIGQMRSIRVFVLGEAYKPGAYALSALSTITHAIYTAGGITEVGSLRNVQLKRRGKLVETFDLYDLLLKGDTSKDLTLLPGDVVFIPPTGEIVGITGEVKRPALYELQGQETVADILKLAGGELHLSLIHI